LCCRSLFHPPFTPLTPITIVIDDAEAAPLFWAGWASGLKKIRLDEAPNVITSGRIDALCVGTGRHPTATAAAACSILTGGIELLHREINRCLKICRFDLVSSTGAAEEQHDRQGKSSFSHGVLLMMHS